MVQGGKISLLTEWLSFLTRLSVNWFCADNTKGRPIVSVTAVENSSSKFPPALLWPMLTNLQHVCIARLIKTDTKRTAGWLGGRKIHRGGGIWTERWSVEGVDAWEFLCGLDTVLRVAKCAFGNRQLTYFGNVLGVWRRTASSCSRVSGGARHLTTVRKAFLNTLRHLKQDNDTGLNVAVMYSVFLACDTVENSGCGRAV